MKELNRSVRAQVAEKREEIAKSSHLRTMYVGVVGLPTETLPFHDGVVVFGSQKGLKYFSTGANGTNLICDTEATLADFLDDQIIADIHLTKVDKVPVRVLAACWEIKDLSLYALRELLRDEVGLSEELLDEILADK